MGECNSEIKIQKIKLLVMLPEALHINNYLLLPSDTNGSVVSLEKETKIC